MEAALLVQPNSMEAELGVANAEIAQSNFAEAVHLLEPLTKAQPRNAYIFDLLAQVYSGSGRKVKAQQAEARRVPAAAQISEDQEGRASDRFLTPSGETTPVYFCAIGRSEFSKIALSTWPRI
jgi:predicted Zn-dependent protease